jgi:hypothetical protein
MLLHQDNISVVFTYLLHQSSDNIKLWSRITIAFQHKDPSRSRYTDTRIMERSHIIDQVSTRVNFSSVYLHAGHVAHQQNSH